MMRQSEQQAVLGFDGNCVGYLARTHNSGGFVVMDENFNILGAMHDVRMAELTLRERYNRKAKHRRHQGH